MHTRIRFDPELIRKYDVPGPRYTSYPTVPQFKEVFTKEDYLSAAARSNASGRPLSLYVHIPFCDTVCFYCACNKVITRNHKRADEYLEHLYREIDGDQVRVTPAGRLLVRNVCMVFDGYLGNRGNRYSRAV